MYVSGCENLFEVRNRVHILGFVVAGYTGYPFASFCAYNPKEKD
jgi:hypothetical protein